MRMRKSVFMLAMVGVFCLVVQASAFVQTDLDRLLKTNECAKCDLSGAVLAGMDLSKAKLEGANLSGADLTKTSLRMADMAGVNLSGAMLNGTVLEAADLFKANLSGTNLAEAMLEGAYLADANMDDGQKALLATAKLDSAPQGINPVAQEKVVGEAVPPQDSTGESVAPTSGAARLKEAEVVAETTPEKPPLPEAEPMHPAQVSDSEGGQAQATPEETAPEIPASKPTVTAPITPPAVEAILPKTPATEPAPPAVGSSSPEALLKQAKKSGVCVECDFSGMKLGSVSLKGLYLERANFSGAQLVGAKFKEASLKSAKFSGANLQGASFKGADLYLADFTGANLEGADLRGAVLDGAILGDANWAGVLLDAGKK